PLNNQLKNQKIYKTPSISTPSPLFCAFAQKIKIPNKLNHLPHQLQGRQPLFSCLKFNEVLLSPHSTSSAGFFTSIVVQ
ncbi:hypothetical protein ACM0EF_22640, partial [Salmonella enterica]|uniref:hypothetical protein n=1 Tax=Salmonella enterica TaxID=28901 RepID=UPI003906C6D2